MAWAEGRSRRHETDIYEMMVFHYLQLDPTLSAGFDEALIVEQAQALGPEVAELWQVIRVSAQQSANASDQA